MQESFTTAQKKALFLVIIFAVTGLTLFYDALSRKPQHIEVARDAPVLGEARSSDEAVSDSKPVAESQFEVSVPEIPFSVAALGAESDAVISGDDSIAVDAAESSDASTTPASFSDTAPETIDADPDEEELSTEETEDYSNDTFVPILNNIAVTDVVATSSVVAWTTGEDTTSKVFYSNTTPLNLETAIQLKSTVYRDEHSFRLTKLKGNTRYYYILESTDRAGNVGVSIESSFKTPPSGS